MRRDLPAGGRMHIDRPLPFLFVHIGDGEAKPVARDIAQANASFDRSFLGGGYSDHWGSGRFAEAKIRHVPAAPVYRQPQSKEVYPELRDRLVAMLFGAGLEATLSKVKKP